MNRRSFMLGALATIGTALVAKVVPAPVLVEPVAIDMGHTAPVLDNLGLEVDAITALSDFDLVGDLYFHETKFSDGDGARQYARWLQDGDRVLWSEFTSA